MSKALFVYYTPRGERSKTKILVDACKQELEGNIEIVDRNLALDPPEMFLEENLNAYMMRDYVGEKDEKHNEALKEFDKNIQQLRECEYCIIAFPMYNYSVPAVVKAWLDSVILNGHTFEMTEKGFKPLLNGKGLILSTAGAAIYHEGGPAHAHDHARPLVQKDMAFIGYNLERIDADGANMLSEEDYGDVLENAKKKMSEIMKTWAK